MTRPGIESAASRSQSGRSTTEPLCRLTAGFNRLIVLGFNDMSTLVDHLSLREREKRDRRDSRGDEREKQRIKRKMNESEETEEIKTFPPLPLPAARIAGLTQL